jgi:predicted 3-demethylubiquinone-9 3-methyltransferase (glyoxalase superfamily)
MNLQKIIPCLWFDKNCEEAINFYIDSFNKVLGDNSSKILSVKRYEAGMQAPGTDQMIGKIITAVFEISGYQFMALDGGPYFKINPSISFMLNFNASKDPKAKENLNSLWKSLSEGGKIMMPLEKYDFSELYGWVEDKFGVSWQLILSDPNGEERPFIVPSMLFVSDVCGKAEEAVEFYTSKIRNSKKRNDRQIPRRNGTGQRGNSYVF